MQDSTNLIALAIIGADPPIRTILGLSNINVNSYIIYAPMA